jgi:hypothetical protein
VSGVFGCGEEIRPSLRAVRRRGGRAGGDVGGRRMAFFLNVGYFPLFFYSPLADLAGNRDSFYESK